MGQSIFLAKLIGPIFIALGAGMLLNAAGYRVLVDEFLRSQALIFVSGLLSITAGLALVLTHNVWAADWRVIITVIGWLGFIGGIVRIVWPQLTRRLAGDVYAWPYTLRVGGAAVVGLGAVLCFFGYFR